MPKANRKRTVSQDNVNSSEDEQPETGNTSDATDVASTPTNNTKSKPKAKKSRPSQKQKQQPVLSQAAIDAINAVAENTNDPNSSIIIGDDEVMVLKVQMSEMSDTIMKQSTEIDLLKKQLNAVMSFIGIKNLPNLSSGSNSVSHTDSVQVHNSIPVISNKQQLSAAPTNVINANVKTAGIINSTLCQSVVSAVYVEQHIKDQRSNSFIITGLPVEHDIDDDTKVKHICKNDLHINIDTDLVKVKRIGTPRSDKIQPVVVILKHKDTAQEIIKKARLLRKSLSEYIRSSVFINPNLTKAESAAAYELRCKRRQSKLSASTSGNNNPGPSTSNQEQ